MLSIHHICIETSCYEESLKFYNECFGFCIVEENKGFHGRDYCSWIKYGNIIIELQTPKNKNEKIISKMNSIGWINHVCFLVDSIEEVVNKIRKIGLYEFRRKDDKDIYLVLGSKISKIIAPEGTIIEIREG